MLKTANLSENSLTLVGVIEKDKIVGGSRSSETNKNLFKSQKPKIFTVLSNVGANTKTMQFLTFEASTPYIQLREAFTKTLIFQNFNLVYHIKTKINALGYAIGGVLN